MKTVWKMQLALANIQEIQVPGGAEFLCAREQFEEICVWFRCDPDVKKETRTIAIVGTGNAAPDDEADYIGSASLRGGQLIFHVFLRRRMS